MSRHGRQLTRRSSLQSARLSNSRSLVKSKPLPVQGEYVAPEKIEGVYARSPFVAQSFVYGNSLRASLVAVVVPDPEHLLPWAAARKLPGDLKTLCGNKVVADAVLRSMQEEGRAAKLNTFEQVHTLSIHRTGQTHMGSTGGLTVTVCS